MIVDAPSNDEKIACIRVLGCSRRQKYGVKDGGDCVQFRLFPSKRVG